MKREPSSQRRGTMLHEAVIVTALSSMIVLLGIRLLHQGMTFATESRGRIVFRQTCQRLATMFRDDIHEATSVSFVLDGTLRIQFPNNGSVVYRSIRPDKPMLERTVTDPEGLVMQEQFRLLDRSRVSFSAVRPGKAVVFEITTAIPAAEQIKRHELRVLARTSRTRDVSLTFQSETVDEKGSE